jgi:hypothetical protein
VKEEVCQIVEKLANIEPNVKNEAKNYRKFLKERNKGQNTEQTVSRPYYEQKRELLNSISKLKRERLFNPIVADGSSVAKKIGNKLLGYFERYKKIEYEWINSNQFDPKILKYFDKNKKRKFNSKSEIYRYFSILLNCNMCRDNDELFKLLADLNITEQSLFLHEDDRTKKIKPKYFDLIFKAKVYDCEQNDGQSMTDSLVLNFEKKHAINEDLNKISKAKYLYYDFQLKSSYQGLISLRLEQDPDGNVESALFQFNGKTKSLNIKLKKTNLKHDDLITE